MGTFWNRPERRATNRDPGRVYTNGPARHSIPPFMSGAASPSDLTAEPPIRSGTGSPYYRAPLRPFSPQSVHQTYIGPVSLLSLRQQQHRLYHSARGRLGGRAVDVAKSQRVMNWSSHILPAMKRSTRRGMKSRGRLSPWITPRTIRPPCSEAHLRAGAGVADQDAGAETSQHVYGKPKDGRHGRRL